jgi:hypothetical protein
VSWRDVISNIREGATDSATEGIPNEVREARLRVLARRRTFGPSDLAELDGVLRQANAVVGLATWLATPEERRSARTVLLRHDTDSDIDGALRLARWEAERGYRATYFVLHDDWYYRGNRDGRPSRYVRRRLGEIFSLGHEIGIHNNAISVGLRTGRDPVEILSEELGHLREAGFEVTGTSAHADPLGRAIGYSNADSFLEPTRRGQIAEEHVLAGVDPGSGNAVSVILRPVHLATLGLTYEAGQIRHRHSLSDSHGQWSRPLASAGELFARGDLPLSILMHPAWWALAGERVALRELA